jgi:riboflavin transporter FmnP
MKKMSLRRNITVALLSAIAYLIMYLQFPLPLIPVFLQIDLSDIPALIAAIMYGPLAGVVVEAVKNIIHAFVMGSVIGEAANFFAGSLFIVVSTYIYHKRKTLRSLIIGMGAGTLVMAGVMSVANYFIIFPLYAYFLGFSIEQAVQLAKAANHSIHDLISLIVLAILPFNIIKGIIISILALPIYARLRPRLRTDA